MSLSYIAILNHPMHQSFSILLKVPDILLFCLILARPVPSMPLHSATLFAFSRFCQQAEQPTCCSDYQGHLQQNEMYNSEKKKEKCRNNNT